MQTAQKGFAPLNPTRSLLTEQDHAKDCIGFSMGFVQLMRCYAQWTLSTPQVASYQQALSTLRFGPRRTDVHRTSCALLGFTARKFHSLTLTKFHLEGVKTAALTIRRIPIHYIGERNDVHGYLPLFHKAHRSFRR